jgi:hypothetical protein
LVFGASIICIACLFVGILAASIGLLVPLDGRASGIAPE